MANETFSGLARKVLLRCESAGLLLAQDWIRNSFRDIAERRQWSWLLKRGQLVTFNQYTTGTASILVGTRTVTLAGGGLVSADHVGLQFKATGSNLIATVDSVDTVANTLTIDTDWWPTALVAAGYSLFKAFVAMPSDFQSIVSVIDPQTQNSISFDKPVAYLDKIDSARATGGSPTLLAHFDYKNGLPRYELWPHQRTAQAYPLLYISRPIDAYDENAAIPSLLPADVILERAMMYCAQWPGTDKNNINPYYNERTAQFHERQFKERIAHLERQDNAHMQQNLWYQTEQLGSGGRNMSASWMQSHD